MIKREPNFLVIEYVPPPYADPSKEHFVLNESLKDPTTQSIYTLMATINRPSVNHFNCCIFEPLLSGKNQLEGWWIHDGIKDKGKLKKMNASAAVIDQKPILLFLQKTLIKLMY